MEYSWCNNTKTQFKKENTTNLCFGKRTYSLTVLSDSSYRAVGVYKVWQPFAGN